MAERDIGKDGSGDENTIAKDIVVTKYKMAAEIVNGNDTITTALNSFDFLTVSVHYCLATANTLYLCGVTNAPILMGATGRLAPPNQFAL